MPTEVELKRRNLLGALVNWAVNDDGTEPVNEAYLRAQFDLKMSELRDALRGASSRTLSDLYIALQLVSVTASSLPLPTGAAAESTSLRHAEGRIRVKKRYDIGATLIYIGTAALGTADAAASWTIKRITLSAGSPTTAQWTAESAAIWANRATEAFS